MFAEVPWLWAGLAAYGIATYYAFQGVAQYRDAASGLLVKELYSEAGEKRVLFFLVFGVVLLTICMTVRWLRIDHGPFVDLFELLISQIWSLGLIYAVSYWLFPLLRPTAVIVLPMLWIMGIWVLTLEVTSIPNPPTYFNDWKWAHVGFGKFFLAFCLIGTGLAGLIFARMHPYFARFFLFMPEDKVLDNYAWRFMLLAFVFESLMLIAGAVWAQDAWGRYWAWDALETSAFLNWLVLGAAIHARFTYNISIRAGAIAIVSVFIFAFITYFGIPFYSGAAHKGVI
ncbi:Cytochrome c-type biogenesis protein CcsA/ResC [hydrothermal vent metagenome]|uniref:Cytochrome c-type biogenesis protein CcsA/ResC n=1 Tax=hydrothermal vent metagenome TaxID=652676 RepID=A0A3B0YQI7_9ZZZZ